ncbi:hypothetical protein [Oceanobacillus alkalisoli]|nr:hypothetical protein [Oceanobacillus alkalisoli]
MRNWIIDYFIGEPEEVTLPQELLFYGVMSSPILIFIVTMILV